MLSPSAPPAHASGISAEIATPERFASLRDAWRALAVRAAEPNVFMDPAVVRASADARPDLPVHVMLAWRHPPDGPRQLAGVWTATADVPESGLPIRVLRAPGHALSFLGTPVLDGGCTQDAFAAILDAIADHPTLPKIVAIECTGDDGPAMRAMAAALAARRGGVTNIARFLRPKLESALDGAAYLAAGMSGGSRKKLRQHRRRLAGTGHLTHVSHRAPGEIRQALEEFLALEAAGWKGRNGTALACDASEARYVRSAVNGLAARGGVSIEALRLDGRPVAMQILMRSRGAAFTWKTAYDEGAQDYSPGLLLLEDCTAAILADPDLRFADSCCYDDSGYMASVWRERQAVTDLLIDARAGGSVAFHMLAGIEKSYREMRSAARRAYHVLKDRQKRLGRMRKAG